MSRVKRGVTAHAKHKKVYKAAKGFYGRRKNTIRAAKPAVEKKCEADFLAHLKPPQEQSYRRELRVCDRKYRNQSGTMYISFTAFCRAEVAQRYSQRALKAGGAGR